MREDFFTEKPRLFQAIVPPKLKHDVRAARGAVLFQALDALLGGACNRTNLIENSICDCAGGGFATATFHSISDWTNLFERETRTFEEGVRRASDVLNFVGKIHGGHFAGAFARDFWIFPDTADDDGAEIEFRRILVRLARAFFHHFSRILNKLWGGDTGRQ